MTNTSVQAQELPSSTTGAGDWHLKLFSKSVLKQAKLRELTASVGDVAGKTCLDLGSDNGVISYYLRALGGQWSSADLSAQAVDSIRSLVRDRVEQCAGAALPFADHAFDVVVVVDMLEHVEDDRVFMKELFRVTKPDGLLVINAPNLKRYSLLRYFRALIGQTDEAHGHLRPGYGISELGSVADGYFTVQETRTYSRFFSEAIDTGIVGAYSALTLLRGKSGSESDASEDVSKGLLFTEADMKRFEKSFKLYSKIYPMVRTLALFDRVIPFLSGYMRITRLRRNS